MTSAPTILATCKQTRFHLLDENPSTEIDVEGLSITITSAAAESSEEASKSKVKGKSKAKASGKELIADAHLRLKGGVHYGLLGRNGTGKSTLLRAIADKLIPGIPHVTRISILQQTGVDDESGGYGSLKLDKTVLEAVLSSDETRNEAVRTAEFLSRSFDAEDPLEPVKAIRKVQHQQAEKNLFLAHKNANLKSGARGFQARKDLKTAEANMESARERLSQDPESIDPEAVRVDTQAAVDTLQTLQSQLENVTLAEMEKEARRILLGLGFKEENLEKKVSTLSGGWRMRCMLASVLVQSPDVMILDEPTNFLDLLGVVWLEKYLQQLHETLETTVVLVSHDRDFINAVCEEIMILQDQKFTYFRGNLAAYEQDFEEQKLYWGRMKESQERQIAHMEASIRENLKIGKKTNDDNKLRQAKSRQKKVDDRMGLQVNANGHRFKLNRDLVGFHLTSRAEIEVPQDERGASMAIPDATELRFPGPLVSLEGINFQYQSDGRVILGDVNLVVHIGDRVGIMGLNGSGKTTLIRILNGQIPPTKGKVSTHPRLKVGYYGQHSVEELQERGQSEPNLTALGLLMAETEGQLNEGAIRGLLSSMGLAGRIASDVPVAKLSGGQLVRLALARIVWNSPQLLVLDEITTHLDFHTVTALATALSSFNGAIILVSHDRFFVRSVIEGKRDTEHKLDEDFEGIEEEESTQSSPRRRSVYVLKMGTLNEQSNGVEQFEKGLVKRVQKLLKTAIPASWSSVAARTRWQSSTASTASTASSSTQRDPALSEIPQSSPHHTASSSLSSSSRVTSLKSAKPFSEFLTDTFHRQHDYLRISVTERCNLRCLYCMPEEGIELSPPARLLTSPEIVYLSSLFVSQGVTKIRLTGGEPTVRKDIVPLMQEIGKLRQNGLRELCLTTNGISLHRKLDPMVEAGLTGVNLSLDTLDPFQFQIMTRRKGFDAVMKSIDRILEMNKAGAGIKLKINCVVMRGMNDREIVSFVDLGREKPIEVRFIEYMPFDGNKWNKGKMFSYQEMLAVIRGKYPTLEKVQDHKNDTSKTYQVPGFEGRVGFITSMTHNFCGTCNRLRITSDGNLKVCLFGNSEVSLRDIIRKENDGQPIDEATAKQLQLMETVQAAARLSDEGGLVNERERQLLDIIGMAVKRKKAKHAGMGQLENMKNRPMILIGGTGSKPDSPTSSSTIHSEETRKSHALPTMSDPDLPHLTPSQTVHMTQITSKPETKRIATSACTVTFSNDRPWALLRQGQGTHKGDVFSVARIAGIMAAKKTPDLVPLCHPGIGITGVEVTVELVGPAEDKNKNTNETDDRGFGHEYGCMEIVATVSCFGRTGVEMEAMTAAMGAALTVYDMLKAVDKGMVIGGVRLLEKVGGKSGHWRREEEVR
ncbi:Molybdenum cofactor biosynthesis protein 1 [Penicillium rolfsii]|nr:Molybdenum cofactor biosynthesis protein 1 [Penicillium rolfsii]